MTDQQLLLKGGRVIDPQHSVDGVLDLLVASGRIASIGPALKADKAREVDVSGCVVAPGFVDLHSHLREPGFEQKGTIATESEAAMGGGFTTICAMPNTDPPPDSAVEVAALTDRFANNSAIRIFPIGCVTRGREGKEVAELTELAEAGCVAFSDDGNPVADARVMRNALLLAGALGIPLSEHSDEPSLSAGGAMNEGRVSERLGLAGQPAASEIAAIARNITLSELTGARIHIAHLTTARGVELVAEAKARGVPVTCEVTPSHLLLTESAVAGTGAEPDYNTNAKINPPLRTEEDRQGLIRGVNNGAIDAIATDHAPHAPEDKVCEFDRAAFGISCFDTAAATVLTLVSRGELTLTSALTALTSGPSSAFGLDNRVPGLGTVGPGAPADLVVLRPDEEWTVRTESFASRGKNSPLDGAVLTGRVEAVVVGGMLSKATGGDC